MGFLDSLRRLLGDTPVTRDKGQNIALVEAWGGGGSGSDDGGPAGPEIVEPPHTVDYDRGIWVKKLRLMLAEKLPVPRQEYDDFLADAYALGFDRDWVKGQEGQAFEMLVRQAVADGRYTEAEREHIDLARQQIRLSESEAEQVVQKVMDEAHRIFGRAVEGP